MEKWMSLSRLAMKVAGYQEAASQEFFTYLYSTAKNPPELDRPNTEGSYTPEMVEVLIDNVRNPAFLDWEVKEQYLTENNYFVMIGLPVTKTIPRNHFLSSSTGCLSSCSKTIAVLQVVAAAPTPASAIGFEGYEKRLEISFYEAPVFADPNGRGFLFVYPYKILIKTCGTTKLLLGILRILELAKELSLPLVAAKYSRGTFIFPDAQPSPHKNFDDEVTFLNHFFDGLRFGGNAYVIGDSAKHKQKWHVYYATTEHP
uniref:Adenosylmethionine decarboxylase n=1 Tax=Zea mays TaxID=4577 RepID=A0A804R9W9_MAIZE